MPYVKTDRNTFGNLRVIVDGNGNTIKWFFLVKLVQFQEQQGLHTATKICKRHLNWQNKKNESFSGSSNA